MVHSFSMVLTVKRIVIRSVLLARCARP